MQAKVNQKNLAQKLAIWFWSDSNVNANIQEITPATNPKLNNL